MLLEQIERVAAMPQLQLLSLNDPRAGNPAVSGNKGSQLHLVRRYHRRAKTRAFWEVPRGVVLTTAVWDDVIASEPLIAGLIEELDSLSADLQGANSEPRQKDIGRWIKQIGEEIRERILAVELPLELQEEVLCAARRLDSQFVAVRSSSTVEDGATRAGAGMGESFLNQDSAGVVEALKAVWASLFTERFVTYRNRCRIPHSSSKMAVVIQSMVRPRAAGVVMSTDPASGRPGFLINARLGLGEGVVQGLIADEFFVGPDAAFLLERNLVSARPSLTDHQVLRLARAIRGIRHYFRTNRHANQVDVEFAFGRDGCIYVVQVRPLTGCTELAPTRPRAVRVIDLERVPPGTEQVQLRGSTVSEGVASGPLQFIASPSAYSLARPGAIVMIPNTNNECSGMFPKISGLLTRGGNATSHAATNARECQIPAVVELTEGDFETLKRFDGKLVTLDACRKTIFLGTMSTKDVEVGSPWADDEGLREIASQERAGERERRTHTAFDQLRKYGNTVRTALGKWLAKPRKRYPPLQLDCYGRAWVQLPLRLRELFPDVPEVERPVQTVLIDRMLCVEVIEGSRNLNPLMHHLSLDDHAALMRARRAMLTRADRLFDGLEDLHAGNVRDVLQCWIDVLTCMHLAFNVQFHLGHQHLARQLRYVKPAEQQRLMELAFRHDGRLASTDRWNVLREKFLELDALTEAIRSDARARAILEQDSLLFVQMDLVQQKPDIWLRVGRLSTRYKCGSEDIRRQSDTPEYLRELQDRIRGGRTFTAAQLRGYCEPYLSASGDTSPAGVETMESRIRAENPDLHELLLVQARRESGESSPATVAQLIERMMNEYRAESAMLPVLERCPTLRSALSLGMQEVLVRENGHQLVTRWQRRLAPLLLRVGRKAVQDGVLRDASEVMELSVDEVVALVQAGPAAGYVSSTAGRNASLEQAEAELERAWARVIRMVRSAHEDARQSTWPARTAAVVAGVGLSNMRRRARRTARERREEGFFAAIHEYEQSLERVLGTLEQQTQAATERSDHQAAVYYREETARIRRRIALLRDRARSSPPRYPPCV